MSDHSVELHDNKMLMLCVFRSEDGAGPVRPADRLHDQTGKLLIIDHRYCSYWDIKGLMILVLILLVQPH